MAKIMQIIAKETNGKSYNTEKYSFDTIGMPSFDYDDDFDLADVEVGEDE